MPSLSRIRLPYPDPPRASAKAPDWPSEDWQLRLICRECDHWYIYEKKDVQWAPYSEPLSEMGNLDFMRTELACSEPGCGSHTRWHVLDNSQLAEADMLDFVLRGDPVVVCENGHPLSAAGNESASVKKAAEV